MYFFHQHKFLCHYFVDRLGYKYYASKKARKAWTTDFGSPWNLYHFYFPVKGVPFPLWLRLWVRIQHQWNDFVLFLHYCHGE